MRKLSSFSFFHFLQTKKIFGRFFLILLFYFMYCDRISYYFRKKFFLLSKKGRNERSLNKFFWQQDSEFLLFIFLCVCFCTTTLNSYIFCKVFFRFKYSQTPPNRIVSRLSEKNEINKNCFRSFHAQSGFKKL